MAAFRGRGGWFGLLGLLAMALSPCTQAEIQQAETPAWARSEPTISTPLSG